jgi:hypothetical protein
MTNIYSIRVLSLIRSLSFLPLLIAGAIGLGAGILGSKMFGKKDDEDERQRDQEERYKRFEQRQRRLEEDSKKRLDEMMMHSQNEAARKEELTRKKLALDAALNKNLAQEDLKDQIEAAKEKSDLNSQNLDEAWMDNLKSFYKKKRKATSLSHE